MCDPGVRATNSYVKDSPGRIGSWVTCGTPSMLFGSFWPWKWMPVVSPMLFVKVARTLSPSTTVGPRTGPGAVEAERLDRVLRGIDLVVHLLDGQLEDLDAVLDRRLERELPARASDAPSPPRNRSTTASAFASWSIAGADGAATAACDPRSCDRWRDRGTRPRPPLGAAAAGDEGALGRGP